ncbi:hypothetical protein BDV18DRAFT_158718 [Aspergillus unguis]
MCFPIDPNQIEAEEAALRAQFAPVQAHIRFLDSLPIPARVRNAQAATRAGSRAAATNTNTHTRNRTHTHILSRQDYPNLFPYPSLSSLPAVNTPGQGFGQSLYGMIEYAHVGLVTEYLDFRIVVQVVPARRDLPTFQPVFSRDIFAAARGDTWAPGIEIGRRAWGWWAKGDGTLWKGTGEVVRVYEWANIPWVEGDESESDGSSL